MNACSMNMYTHARRAEYGCKIPQKELERWKEIKIGERIKNGECQVSKMEIDVYDFSPYLFSNYVISQNNKLVDIYDLNLRKKAWSITVDTENFIIPNVSENGVLSVVAGSPKDGKGIHLFLYSDGEKIADFPCHSIAKNIDIRGYHVCFDNFNEFDRSHFVAFDYHLVDKTFTSIASTRFIHLKKVNCVNKSKNYHLLGVINDKSNPIKEIVLYELALRKCKIIPIELFEYSRIENVYVDNDNVIIASHLEDSEHCLYIPSIYIYNLKSEKWECKHERVHETGYVTDIIANERVIIFSVWGFSTPVINCYLIDKLVKERITKLAQYSNQYYPKLALYGDTLVTYYVNRGRLVEVIVQDLVSKIFNCKEYGDINTLKEVSFTNGRFVYVKKNRTIFIEDYNV